MKTAIAFMALAAWVMVAGCAGNMEQSTKAPEKTEAPAAPAGPQMSDPPAKWVQGKVFRVWPFGNGELMAYLGAKDGLHTGDMLALMRGGQTLNSIEVIEVHSETFYGRVVQRDDPGLWPKEGDIAAKFPPMMD
jgi:hypothetical protein